MTLDLIKEAFVVYMAYFGGKMMIHPACKAQIASMMVEEIIILTEYLDFINIFQKNQLQNSPSDLKSTNMLLT